MLAVSHSSFGRTVALAVRERPHAFTYSRPTRIAPLPPAESLRGIAITVEGLGAYVRGYRLYPHGDSLDHALLMGEHQRATRLPTRWYCRFDPDHLAQYGKGRRRPPSSAGDYPHIPRRRRSSSCGARQPPRDPACALRPIAPSCLRMRSRRYGLALRAAMPRIKVGAARLRRTLHQPLSVFLATKTQRLAILRATHPLLPLSVSLTLFI
ncbi:hypothetical protein C8Q77DRAFT_429236 [Trametes polyzona]|nr:hypothetical protein C8Q77DRAFT_429236 [Trametes polyzona]